MIALDPGRGRSSLSAGTRLRICWTQISASLLNIQTYFPLVLMFSALGIMASEDEISLYQITMLGVVGIALGLLHGTLSLGRESMRVFGLNTKEIRVQLALCFAVMAVCIHGGLALLYIFKGGSGLIGRVWIMAAVVGLLNFAFRLNSAKNVSSVTSVDLLEKEANSEKQKTVEAVDPWREIVVRPIRKAFAWLFGILVAASFVGGLVAIIPALLRGDSANFELVGYAIFFLFSALSLFPELASNCFVHWLGLSQSRREFRWGLHRALLPLLLLLPLVPLVCMLTFELTRFFSDSFAENNPGITAAWFFGLLGAATGFGAISVLVLPNLTLLKLKLSGWAYFVAMIGGIIVISVIFGVGGALIIRDRSLTGSLAWGVGVLVVALFALTMLPAYQWGLKKVDTSKASELDTLGAGSE